MGHAAPTAPTGEDLAALTALLARCHCLMVLTGAGCSTESGIPDYRGPDGDADLGDADYDAFVLPLCVRCGGDLKPRVVETLGLAAPSTSATGC